MKQRSRAVHVVAGIQAVVSPDDAGCHYRERDDGRVRLLVQSADLEAARELPRTVARVLRRKGVKGEIREWFASHADAKADLFDYIQVFYNQRRRHSAAGRMSPAAYERRLTQVA
jgi:transposase InsO family protein